MEFCRGDSKCLMIFLGFLILIFSFIDFYSKWIILGCAVLIFINALLDIFLKNHTKPGFFPDGTKIWGIFFRDKDSEKIEPTKEEVESVLSSKKR